MLKSLVEEKCNPHRYSKVISRLTETARREWILLAEEVEELKTRQDKSPPLKYKKGENDQKQKSIKHK